MFIITGEHLVNHKFLSDWLVAELMNGTICKKDGILLALVLLKNMTGRFLFFTCLKGKSCRFVLRSIASISIFGFLKE
jgi:hypothetical protein